MTQLNLGVALQTLGTREGGATRLEEAVAAYRAALDRDPLPIDQANTQFNMGQALIELGRREEALRCFHQAEAVFRAVGMAQQAAASGQWIISLRGEMEPNSAGTAARIPLTPN